MAVPQVFLERLDQNLPGQAPNSILCTPAQVQPVLQRLKTTLTGSGAALLASSVLLFGLIKAGTDADGVYGAAFACLEALQNYPFATSGLQARTELVLIFDSFVKVFSFRPISLWSHTICFRPHCACTLLMRGFAFACASLTILC